MEGVVIIPLLRGYIRGLATTIEAWPMGEVKDNMGVDGEGCRAGDVRSSSYRATKVHDTIRQVTWATSVRCGRSTIAQLPAAEDIRPD